MKRYLGVSAPEYRTTKSIIQATVDLILILDEAGELERDKITEEVVLLTISEEGFLTYLLDEFLRDLHPMQRELMRSIKFAEGLETLSLIGEFKVDEKYTLYMSMIKNRIKKSEGLLKNSSEQDVQKVIDQIKEDEKEHSVSFESLDAEYLILGLNLYDELYARLNKKNLDKASEQSLSKLEAQIGKLSYDKNILKNKLDSSVEGSLAVEVVKTIEF